MMRFRNPWLAVVGAIVLAGTPHAEGGGSASSKGSASKSSSHNSSAGHGHRDWRGYRYYGLWPYGYYQDDRGVVITPFFEDDNIAEAEESEAVPAIVVRTQPATVRVSTVANARLWFDGSPTSQTGEVRTFSTPPLEPGRSYSYEIRACWLEAGRPVVRSLTIKVAPGETAKITMR